MERSPDAPPADAASRWEEAYQDFETSAQETRKFLRRLRALGADRWDPNSGVLEICCGRGNGLMAWHYLGFSDIVGLDRSRNLLATYRGPGRRLIADACLMPLADASRDIVAVQGGLHHLASFKELDRTLAEMCRVVRSSGHLIVVEPWLTPFLRIVHVVAERQLARRISRKIDALGTMIDLERETYEAWLNAPGYVLSMIRRYIEPITLRLRRGKLMMVGRPRRREAARLG